MAPTAEEEASPLPTTTGTGTKQSLPSQAEQSEEVGDTRSATNVEETTETSHEDEARPSTEPETSSQTSSSSTELAKPLKAGHHEAATVAKQPDSHPQSASPDAFSGRNGPGDNRDVETGRSAASGSEPPPAQDGAPQQGRGGGDDDIEAQHHHQLMDWRQIRLLHHHKAPLPPSDKFTPHQIFYIFGLDGVGAMIISGAINFAIAYAMYTTQDITKHPIRLFRLPNTLAGDAAVTVFLQSIMTWMIELALVSHDLRTGSVQPAGFLAEPTHPLARWYLLLDDDQSLQESASQKSRPVRYLAFVVRHVLRALLIGVVGFLLFWGPSVGILTAVGTRCGDDWCYGKRWAPEIFKGLLGGLLALVTTPPMAALWVFRAGWLKKRAEESSDAAPAPIADGGTAVSA